MWSKTLLLADTDEEIKRYEIARLREDLSVNYGNASTSFVLDGRKLTVQFVAGFAVSTLKLTEIDEFCQNHVKALGGVDQIVIDENLD